MESITTSEEQNVNSKETVRKQMIATVISKLMESSSSESEDEEERIIVEMLRSDDLDLFLEEKNQRNCELKYIDLTVPNYTEQEFRMHFRISRNLYENLRQRFFLSDFYQNLRADKRLSEKTYLLVFFWFAGHEDCSFRDLAARFNLSQSSVHKIIGKVTMFISSLSPDEIKWPTQQLKQESSEFFKRKCYFSQAIGCIDVTHIPIHPPKKSKDDYINSKGITSICLQAICNEKRKFINIFVGFPGSSQDSWVFQNSTIYSKLSLYCKDYYLLADSAYPCSKYLITPYRDKGHITNAQKYFNRKLSSGRIAIEHSFVMLKQRFPRLNYCMLKDIEKLCHFIRACCVLHNMASEDDMDFICDTSPDVTEDFMDYGEVARGNYVRDPICQEMLRLRTEFIKKNTKFK